MGKSGMANMLSLGDEDPKMPALPAHYDAQTLTQYFDMVDTMDPKGGALA